MNFLHGYDVYQKTTILTTTVEQEYTGKYVVKHVFRENVKEKDDGKKSCNVGTNFETVYLSKDIQQTKIDLDYNCKNIHKNVKIGSRKLHLSKK